MLPFREIALEDKPMVEHCGSHYNYHLCERCFVDLFMWRSHYNTQICFKDGFMLVKMSPLDGGHDCYLAPVGQGDLSNKILKIVTNEKQNAIVTAIFTKYSSI